MFGQLVKLCDTLAVPLAAGVVHMATDCGCSGLIKEVMNEIGQSDVGETDSRNISMFLENIAISRPELIIPILDEIMDYLSNDVRLVFVLFSLNKILSLSIMRKCDWKYLQFYTMRNCVLGVMGAIVQKALIGEELTEEQKEQRDECLNNLEEHILDSNAYVRSKVLQIWQRLCCEGVVPLARYGKLLTAIVLRLEDKSANVRRQALQLLHTLLQSNPFAGKVCAMRQLNLFSHLFL